MSDKNVRSHTNKSNRASARDPIERKVVYKSVLDNPFRVPWPKVPTNIQNALLSQTVAMLGGVAEYQSHRQQLGKKSKRKRAETGDTRKKQKLPANFPEEAEQVAEVPPQSDEMDASSSELLSKVNEPSGSELLPQAPEVLSHVICGINEVTKKLETVANSLRQRFTLKSTSTDASEPRADTGSQLVLVCCGDVNPPILIDHIPNLVAACNSIRRASDPNCTWLIPLPAGAESTLAGAMGLRRVSVLLLDSSATAFDDLRHFLTSVTVIRAPWLRPSTTAHAQALVPTHIKQLRTTAPKDMKVAKEQRAQRRAEAKQRKREKLNVAKKSPASSKSSLGLTIML